MEDHGLVLRNPGDRVASGDVNSLLLNMAQSKNRGISECPNDKMVMIFHCFLYVYQRLYQH